MGCFPIGRQLVIVRLPSGGLWINSPIPWTPVLRAELARLGNIHHVVAPNCTHDECLKEFQVEYPAAIFHAAPGLAAKRRDLRFAVEPLSDTPHPEWADVLFQHLVRGNTWLNETVFLHRPSRSLIITDLAFNCGPESHWLIRFFMRLDGIFGRLGLTRWQKSRMKDRAAVLVSLNTILGWDFDRIIVGHGRNLEIDGKAALRDAFTFLGSKAAD
jgi:hypothetical protein